MTKDEALKLALMALEKSWNPVIPSAERESNAKEAITAAREHMTEKDDDIQDYKKPWVKLRNEEISKILQAHEQDYQWFAFARAIEKLSKDKNA